MPDQATELAKLASQFRDLRLSEFTQLPLYEHLCELFEASPQLLTLLQQAPAGQRRPVLALAAINQLVHDHPTSDLAQYFRSTRGQTLATLDLSLVADALADLVTRQQIEFVEIMRSNSIQTNEVNRSVLWKLASHALGAELGPIDVAFVELGASAGLNMFFDDYSYDFEHCDPTQRSNVACRCSLAGAEGLLDHAPVRVTDRLGLDIAPVNLADPVKRSWLRSCVWPEQVERLQRFDAAIEHLLRQTMSLERADITVDLGTALGQVRSPGHLMVVNSWVLTYLRKDLRRRVIDSLDEIGRHRDLTWFCAEPSGALPIFEVSSEQYQQAGGLSSFGLDTPSHTVVGCRRYRNGEATDSIVAFCHAHLHWCHWLEPRS